MRTSLRGVLPVYERVIFLSVLVCMRKGNFNVIRLSCEQWGKEGLGHIVGKQILQSVATENAMPIIHNGKSCVQIGIVTEHFLHDIIMERVVLEERVVWFKVNIRTVFVC